MLNEIQQSGAFAGLLQQSRALGVYLACAMDSPPAAGNDHTGCGPAREQEALVKVYRYAAPEPSGPWRKYVTYYTQPRITPISGTARTDKSTLQKATGMAGYDALAAEHGGIRSLPASGKKLMSD